MRFTKEGEYELTIFNGDNSVINVVDGTYELDKSELEITTTDFKHKHHIIESESNQLNLISEDGIYWTLTKN